MAESNRRRLDRLEQLAHESVGDARLDVSAAMELEAEILEAEIWAHKLACKACTPEWAIKHIAPARSREEFMARQRRERLSAPLRIKERCKALEQRVREHGATPTVQATLVAARSFLEGPGVR